jgi:hypothetical protein
MLLKKLLITKQRADLLQYQCGWTGRTSIAKDAPSKYTHAHQGTAQSITSSLLEQQHCPLPHNAGQKIISLSLLSAPLTQKGHEKKKRLSK